MTLNLVPAYGRSYVDGDDVLNHWVLNKDFKVRDHQCRHNGRYVNAPDLVQYGPEYTAVRVVYDGRNACVIDLATKTLAEDTPPRI